MARKKSTTFQGATILDTDVDAASYQRVIENAVGDVALVFDKVTGQHGETSTIIHDGSTGRGARLGIPIVNQYIGRGLNLYGTPPAKGGNGGAGTFWIWCAPVFLVPGETTLQIEMSARFNKPASDLKLQVQVFSTSFASEATSAMDSTAGRGEPDSVFACSLSGLTAGAVHYVAISIDTSTLKDFEVGFLSYVRIRPRMTFSGRRVGLDFPNGIARAPALRATSDFGIFSPAATEGVAHRNFDAAMFGTQLAIDGYTTAGLNRNLNGLLEYVTGYPAGGNATYTQIDQDGAGVADATDPARVRFESHARALFGGGSPLYASEPQIAFPIWCECFGAFQGNDGKFAVDLAEPPSNGMIRWYAPWPISTAALAIRSIPCLMPDFQSTSSTLTAHILIGSDANANVGNWAFQIQTTTGNSASVAPVACSVANTLWRVSITGIPFTGDNLEQVSIVSSRTGAKTGIGELCVIGACLYFSP